MGLRRLGFWVGGMGGLRSLVCMSVCMYVCVCTYMKIKEIPKHQKGEKVSLLPVHPSNLVLSLPRCRSRIVEPRILGLMFSDTLIYVYLYAV